MEEGGMEEGGMEVGGMDEGLVNASTVQRLDAEWGNVCALSERQ